MPADPAVLIVGAGPTGLACALWLTKAGIPVRIVDAAPRAGTTSRALAVQARTLEFYRQLGIADTVVSAGVIVANLNMWVNGRRRAQMPFARSGEGLSPYPFPLVLPQDVHEQLLIDALETLGVRVERDTSLTRVEQTDAGVRATLRRLDGADEVVDVPYLAGCDGASSTVREQLGVGFPGGTYTGVFYVADVDASGPTSDCGLHVDIEDADFAIVFPLKARNRVRLVGVVRDAPAEGRELTFDDVKGKALEHLGLRVERVHWFSTYRVHHRVANRFRVGRVFLLGDAAHIHSPVGGQGMNTGIGDAVNLAWKLASVLKENAPPALLDSYEPERIAFAKRLVATTDRAFVVVTARGRVARLIRTKIVPAIAPIALRMTAVQRFFFRTVSQIEIEYRSSPISEGRAGGIEAGDRLPWIDLGNRKDNFAPLGSIAWQVHVYGDADLTAGCAALGLAFYRFAWQPAMDAAGLMRDALYLVRPDGHVAFAHEQSDLTVLRAYLVTHVALRAR